MSRFIRLTDFFGNPVYVNVDKIETVSEYISYDGPDGSVIAVGGNFTHVQDGIDEVLRMIGSEELSISHVSYYDPLHKKADIDAHIADLESRYSRDDDGWN